MKICARVWKEIFTGFLADDVIESGKNSLRERKPFPSLFTTHMFRWIVHSFLPFPILQRASEKYLWSFYLAVCVFVMLGYKDILKNVYLLKIFPIAQ